MSWSRGIAMFKQLFVHEKEKTSGPLLDRIDIHIEVPAAEYKELASKKLGTSSDEIRGQVASARLIQEQRYRDLKLSYNANLSSKQIRQFCELDADGMSMMKNSVNEMGLSARAHDKILRVSRTIADLDDSDSIQPHHLHEAINFRILDRQLWS